MNLNRDVPKGHPGFVYRFCKLYERINGAGFVVGWQLRIVKGVAAIQMLAVICQETLYE